MKKERKKQKGITLVALVITIIILLILAGISISTLTNQGILKKVVDAKKVTEEKTAEEDAILENYLEQMNVMTKGLSSRVKPGDYVSYTPSSTSYTTDKSKTGYSSSQTINPSELNLWRVLNINDDNKDLVKEYVFKDIVLAIYDGKMEQSGMFQVILPMLEEMKVYRKQR